MSMNWKIALRNLSRNHKRNVATLTAIAFGYGGLVLLGGYILRVEHYLRVNTAYVNHTGHLSIYKEGGLEKVKAKPRRYSLSAEEQKLVQTTLEQDPNVEFVGRYLYGTGLLGNGCKTVPFIATGIEPETEKRIRGHSEVQTWTPELAVLKKGKGFWERSGHSGLVSVTSGLARLLGKPQVAGDPGPTPAAAGAACETAGANVQLAGQTYDGGFSAVDADIVSHHTTGMDLMEDTSLTAPLELLQKLYDTDAVSYMAVFLKEDSSLASKAARLQEKLKSMGLRIEVYPFSDDRVGTFYVGGVNFLLVMAAFFIFLIFGAVVLSVVNSVTMSLIERTKEFGTLRSLGFTPRALASILARENSVLSLAGIALGTAVTILICWIVNGLNIRFHSPGIAGDMQFVLTPNWQLCLVTSVVVSVLVAITTQITTKRRAQRKIVELLTATAA